MAADSDAIIADEPISAYVADVTINDVTYQLEETIMVDGVWDKYCSFSERILVGGELIARYNSQNFAPTKGTKRPYYTIDFDTGKIQFFTGTGLLWEIPDCTEIKVLYFTYGGRYEWTVVGRDASTVDSLGASLVTAAFKNKHIEIGIAGVDMFDPLPANQIPWVMRKFGTGDTYVDYRDALKQAAFRDDWCDTCPIASSNMIFIGGAEPNVNLGAYYFNDFTDAFSDFTGEFTDPYTSPWSGKIASLTCWDQNTYSSNSTHGYAVIATYKDLNATIGLSIYGHWGRDTYYASKWFHEEGIYQLQEAPVHVTSIILMIDYDDPQHPTISIVEVLGTISEIEWDHHGEIKGGIHDCP